ncbi:MAG: DUF3995 domain-containing protein [Cyclobacteriaceae bacterium]
MELLALTIAGIFFWLGALHFYWAMGFTRGLAEAVPVKPSGEKIMNPSPTACVVMGLALWSMAIVQGMHAGWWLDRFSGFAKWGTLAIAIVFLMRVVGDFKWVGWWKKITNTPFAKNDTRYYVPLCLFISASSFALFFYR